MKKTLAFLCIIWYTEFMLEIRLFGCSKPVSQKLEPDGDNIGAIIMHMGDPGFRLVSKNVKSIVYEGAQRIVSSIRHFTKFSPLISCCPDYKGATVKVS